MFVCVHGGGKLGLLKVFDDSEPIVHEFIQGMQIFSWTSVCAEGVREIGVAWSRLENQT